MGIAELLLRQTGVSGGQRLALNRQNFEIKVLLLAFSKQLATLYSSLSRDGYSQMAGDGYRHRSLLCGGEW